MKRRSGPRPAHRPKPPRRLPKLCGADMELGNFILGAPGHSDTCADAAEALLREISGQLRTPGPQPAAGYSAALSSGPAFSGYGGYYGDGGAGGCPAAQDSGGGGCGQGYDPQDWGRKFAASNGGCSYIDLRHLEVVTPEVRSARELVAYTHAMFRVAHQAQLDANAKLPPGRQIELLANNSDGRGHSWGTHLSFLITRRAFENIHYRKMHHLLFLAAYQVSSIVFTGQGKTTSENGRPAAPYQISGRADFFETLAGAQTTCRRPIVNARDEALCGPDTWIPTGARAPRPMARLHVIFYDNNLCHVAGLLKVGVLQIILALIERERVDPGLILDDPLAALVAWSRDTALRTRAKTVSGKYVTPVELQLLFFERAAPFVEAGACDGIVPQARDILALWHDTLAKLRQAAGAADAAALDPLAPRLDWVLKLRTLQDVLARHPELEWNSPQIRHLDQLYSSLDPGEGVYWAYQREGFVETVVSDADIERCVHEPPADTRAWGRAMLLRRAGADEVAYVDWDCIRFKLKGGDWWPRYRTLELRNPLAFTRAECERLFQRSANLGEILEALGAPRAVDDGDAPRALVRRDGDGHQPAP